MTKKEHKKEKNILITIISMLPRWYLGDDTNMIMITTTMIIITIIIMSRWYLEEGNLGVYSRLAAAIRAPRSLCLSTSSTLRVG